MFVSFLLVVLHAAPVGAFGFDDVAKRAQLQTLRPYQSACRLPPAELAALTYDQYRDIRFRPDHALGRREQLPFELMFFHLGKFQTEAVRINEVTPRGVQHIPYRSADFDYGQNKLSPGTWGDVGFAGFRAHYPLNGGEYKGELVVFLGASYFCALGTGQRYGLSARGLAIEVPPYLERSVGGLVPSVQTSALTPKCQHRRNCFAPRGLIRLIHLEVAREGGTVLLAVRMHTVWISQGVDVCGARLGREAASRRAPVR